MVVLLMVVIRDGYIYGREPNRTESLTYTALALLFLLAHEAFTMQWLPSLAMPKDVFFKGSVSCLPLLWMLRMVSRPLPAPDPNTRLWAGMSPERIYWSTLRLNLLWIFMFYFSVGMFTLERESYIDDVRGLFGLLCINWIAVQTNRLDRRNYIETLNTDWRRLRLRRLFETLPQGLKKGEPFYSWYIVIEGVIFSLGGVNTGIELWYWQHGEPEASVWRIATSLIAFIVSAVAWRHVKAVNRLAIEALRAHI